MPRATQDTTIDNAPCLYRAITFYGPSFQTVPVRCASKIVVLQPRCCRNNIGLGCSDFARRYYRNHSCFLLLRLIRCFSSPGLLPAKSGMTCLQHAGLPHSDTCGSYRVCRSPQLFAAYRVLLRLWEPRHSPYALFQLVARPCILFYSYSTFVFLRAVRYQPYALCPNMSMNLWQVPLATICKDRHRMHPVPCGEYRSRTDDLLRARQAL